MKKILFGVCSLWLWHATRTLPIIKMFNKKWYSIDIISFSNALNFLKNELKNEKNINFISLEKYPDLERWNWLMLYIFLFADILKTIKNIKKEFDFVKKIEYKYEFIFSDWKYWIFSKNVPSFLLSHQISIILPKWLQFFQKSFDIIHTKYLKNFTKVFIPDYSDKNISLSWKLSHGKFIKKLNAKYVGIFSSLYKKEYSDEDFQIDYLFTISWFLYEHKQSFVEKLINEAKHIKWNKVFILWDTKVFYKKKLDNNITIYSYLSGEKRLEFFNKAKYIVSRSWYTTIMDIIELWKKWILFPTPNQTEQEYLAEYLKNNNNFIIWNTNDNLIDLIWKINNINPYEYKKKTKTSLKIIYKEIKQRI